MRGDIDLIAVREQQQVSIGDERSDFTPLRYLAKRPMPSDSASENKLRVALRWSVISFVITAATWLAVVFWWQTTQRVVSSRDALLYLVALPVTFLLCVGLIQRTFFSKAAVRNVSAAQSTAVHASIATQPREKSTDVQSPNLAVVGAWTMTSISSYGDEFLNHLSEHRSRPTPDTLLTDEQGFPVLSARAKELDTHAVEEALASAIADGEESIAQYIDDPRDALLRSLALLESLLAQLAQDWPLNMSDDETPDQHDRSVMTLRGIPPPCDTPSGLRLQVKLLLPDELDAEEVNSARTYLVRRLAAHRISAADIAIDVAKADEGATALTVAEEFRRGVNHPPASDIPQALLLLSAVSVLCPTVVEAWEARGLMFSSQQPNGRMLGEAAFGVLCANEVALQATGASPLCYLTPAVCAQRTPETKGKAKNVCLPATIEAALAAARISGEVIGTVICDADHRTSRALESIDAMLSQTPRLDAIENRLALNEACGYLGVASVLGILAAGAIQADQAGHPVLLFNVGHETERAAAALIPTGMHETDSSFPHLHAA